MGPIDATQVRGQRDPGSNAPRRGRAARALAILAASLIVSLAFVVTAFAGTSSTGKLAFFPCARCHPVTADAKGNPSHPLPIGLTRHEITLEVHDVLGKDEKACLACHDDPGTRDPGKLKAPDGTLIDITGDVSRVCQKCHFEKYREWQAGIHGKRQPKCTSAGCHDPHTPSWIYIPALPPFLGTGIEVHAVANREPFKPLASPPVPPAVLTPTWLVVVESIGALIALGILGLLTFRRSRT